MARSDGRQKATGDVKVPADRRITVARFVAVEWGVWLDEQVRFGNIRLTTAPLLASERETLQNPCCVTRLGFRGPCTARVSRGLLRLTDQEVGGSSPSGRATETLATQGFVPLNSATVAESLQKILVKSWSGHRDPPRSVPRRPSDSRMMPDMRACGACGRGFGVEA